ncbi:fibrocystin isoform X2 [Lithobates pipiens]
MKKLRNSGIVHMILYFFCTKMTSPIAFCLNYTVDPKEGSIAGGTWITIWFNDSSLYSSVLQYFGQGCPLEVHMTNSESPPIYCDVLPLYSPSSSIKCKTRSAGQEGMYEVSVFHGGQQITKAEKVIFKFSLQETPLICDVSPSSGVPGGVIKISGKLMTDHFENYDFNIDYIEGPVIMKSEWDGWSSLCSLADKISDSMYPIHVEHGNGTLLCRTEGNYIGSQNLTFSVSNKGRSKVSKDSWHISAKQELFLYQTHSEILSVSPESGSIGGGTDITIIGDFFQYPAEVIAAGTSCKVKSVSPRAIICTTTPGGQTQNPPYPGNRGLWFELWDGLADLDITGKPLLLRGLMVSDASSPDIRLKPGRHFSARLQGFFVCPEKNNYTFWIQADSKAKLFFSSSEKAELKFKIASIPHGISTWTDHWELDWDDRWKQKSLKIELLSGQKYYLEMLQYGTGPKTSMKVGIQIHNTWLNPEVVNTYQREKHQIVAKSSRLPEIQRMTFSGEGLVQFCWDGVASKPVHLNSTAKQIQVVIEDMLSVHCVTNLPPGDIFYSYGFEEDEMNEPGTSGVKAGWTEPYCGMFSMFKPSYILKASDSLEKLELNKYSHVCFAYKGYLKNYLLVSVTYNTTKESLNTVRKNYTCPWEFHEHDPESWKFVCMDLWMCIQDTLGDADRPSSIHVDQILLMQAENKENNWYFIDEIIIANGSIKVYQVDPKPAQPGGHLLKSISITGTYPSFNVTALVANCGINLPLIELCGAATEDKETDQLRQTLSQENEVISLVVTRLQAASPPIGGTFSISLSNTIIPGIPVHISPLHLREILISNVNDVTVQYINATDFTVTRDVNSCHHIVWTLYWTNMTGDLPNFIQVTADNLTGLNATVITRVVFDGGVFIWPIFSDMLASANSLPQVTVHVNDIPARCSGSCTFQPLLSVTPLVTDIQYSTGGQIMTLIGVHFGDVSMVEFGSYPCLLWTYNCTTITCVTSSQTDDVHGGNIRIKTGQHWITFPEQIQFDSSLNPAITSITPNVSSTAGGKAFIGLSDFDNSNRSEMQVKVNDVSSQVQSVTPQGILVILPQFPSGLYNLSVVINGVLLKTTGFQPVIRYISGIDLVEPCCGSFLGGTIITIIGKGFTANTSLLSVTIGVQSCRLINTTADLIKCQTPPFPSSDSDEENITVPLVVSIINPAIGMIISNVSNCNDFIFTYHRNFTPNISNLSWIIENGSLWFYLSGYNFSNSVILFENTQNQDKYEISYVELQKTHFEIPLDGFGPGKYQIKVWDEKMGFARMPLENQMVELIPLVSYITPGEGPLCGGIILTICGSFYKISNSSVFVTLSRGYVCPIYSANGSTIQCTLKTDSNSNMSVSVDVDATIVINGVPSVCTGNCTFHLVPELSPVINEIFPRLEGAFPILYVLGQRLGGKIHILVDGSSECIVTSWNATMVKCHLKETIPIGNHTVIFPFAADGLACLSSKPFHFIIEPQITKLYPVDFGLNGGGCLTIEGSGLQGLTSTLVFIGSFHRCLVTTANYTMVQCILPPLTGTMRVIIQVDDYNTTGGIIHFSMLYTPMVHSLLERHPSLKIVVSAITAVEKLHITVEHYNCTNITGNTSVIQCDLPDLPAGIYEVRCLDGDRGWATSNITYHVPLIVTSLKNNIDCIDNRSLHISGTGFSPGNTSVTICGSPCQISSHLATPKDLYCSDWMLNSSWSFLCDMTLESGARCPENLNTAIQCDVTVQVGTIRVTESLAYLHVCHRACDAFSLPNSTANIVNITGLFISPKVEKDEVLIYIGCCSVAVATEAEMECQAPNQPIITQITAIRESWLQNTQGEDTPYHFCSLWSRNSSWPTGHPPLDGDNVTVERGRTLLLNTNTSLLNLLHIKGGVLAFLGPGPIHLRAHYILVSDGGELLVGADNVSFPGKAHITLYGSSYTTPLYPYGVKFLAVRNATISMNGWVPKVIFTHLATAARANDTDLVLVDPVDWRVGDEVVLCGGRFEGLIKQQEILNIRSINDTHLSVSPSLRYSYDIVKQFIEAYWIILRPVIALVSRDIVVQGNLTDEYVSHYQRCQQVGVSDISECPYDRSEKILGSQDLGLIFVAQAFKNELNLIHISGVQFLHTGQAFNKPLGAINIIGNVPMFGSYIQRSIVKNSFARGGILTGISHFTVVENIFYDIQGHGLVVGEPFHGPLEIKHNLMIRMSGSNGLSNIEILAPAAFYIKSPSSTIEDNWVCSSGYGYFYHLSPSGPSQTVLGSFKNNVAESCTRSGFWIHPEYVPISNEVPAMFQDFTAWKSQGGAQISRCGNISFKGFKIYSCQEFGINISESRGNTEISDSLLLGHFDGEDMPCMMSGVATPKRFQLVISNTTFMNFDRQTCSALSTCTGCMRGQGGFTVKYRRLSFINSPRKSVFPFAHSALMKDIDGSFFGLEGSHLLATTDILPGCCLAKADISGGVPASVCPADNKFHRTTISLGRAPNVGYSLTFINSRNYSSTVNYVEDTLSSLYGWQALLLDKENYAIIFHSPDRRNTLHYSATFDDFEAGNDMLVQHWNLPRSVNISITCGLKPGRPLQFAPLPGKSEACDWHYNSTLGILTYIVSGEGLIRVMLTVEEIMAPTTTPAPDPLPPLVLYWSSPDSWVGVGEGWGGHDSTIPQAGDDVIILPNRTVIVDIALPPLGGLYVLGNLEFPSQSSNVLNVTCILISGGELRIGTLERPLERGRRMHILIRASEGAQCDRLSGLSVSPGVIEVYGKLKIHSAYPSKPWTRLGADIAPGNEMMTLNDTIDWQPGDKIVVGSTSFEAHQAEVVHLRDVYGYIIRIWGKLNHRHTGTTYNIEDAWRIPLAAEVGLLSRNVHIEADIPCTGRILVGQYKSAQNKEYIGTLEISNVEISNFGSSLHSAITFTNTSHHSSIVSSSIHQNCGGGIHASNSSNILLHSNVIVNITGHGIHVFGDNFTVTNNLLVLIKQLDTQSEWVKGIKMHYLSQASLSRNAVAGSERIAYHVRGESCYSDEISFLANVAHSSLHGLHIYWDDGFKNCTKITGFTCYKNYDYGLVFFLEGSVRIENVALVDNGIGLFPVVSQGSVESYKYPKQDVTLQNSVIIASSPEFDCIRDRIKPFSALVTMRDRAPISPFGGRIGILWPTFTERPRRWPNYPWHMLGSDGAVPGIMKMQDVTFSGFKRSCYSNDAGTCIMSNPESPAIMTPVTGKRIKVLHISQENKFYFHQMPRTLGCPVSMECSGTQMALFKDLDGTFTGLSPPISVFPKSELNILQPCFNFGIYRTEGQCTYKSNSQAHMCHQTDLSVVILENIITPVDPIGPILAITDHFAQVFVSGGTTQDQCCNITSHKTFYAILPANKMTKVCFTGTTPRALKLQLHGAQNSTKLVLALFYDIPDSFYIVSGGERYSTVLYDIAPDFQHQKHGSSFFSFRENLLYVILQGDEPLEIWTKLSVHLFFYVVEGTRTDPYNQLGLKLAHFLSIDPSQVRVLQIFQGQASTLKTITDNYSKRKRHCPSIIQKQRRVRRHSGTNVKDIDRKKIHRQESQLELLIVEIDEPNVLSPTNTSKRIGMSSTQMDLQNISNSIINGLQTGELEKTFSVQIDYMMVAVPNLGNRSRNSDAAESRSAVYVRPHRLFIDVQPVGGPAGQPLLIQPKITFLDIKGNRVRNLGHSSSPWCLSVYLKDTSTMNLKGNTTVLIQDGWANFSNLVVSSSRSNWCLIFNVTSPPGLSFSIQSQEFHVFRLLKQPRENVFMLVVFSSAASAIVLFLFFCCLFKWKKGGRLKQSKPERETKNIRRFPTRNRVP